MPLKTMCFDPDELEHLDYWAIRVAVREGKAMKLTLPEMVLATKLCRRKGMDTTQTADRLGITRAQAQKYWKVEHPVDPDEVPFDVVGWSVDNERPSFSPHGLTRTRVKDKVPA